MLKNLTDDELNIKLKSIAVDERRLTAEALLHIAEVDRRRLFLAKAYPSLFEYLVREIGYSDGAAQRRIDAARLFHRVPEVAARVNDGSLNLAQITKLQKICRQIKKDSGESVAISAQKEILDKLKNQGSKTTDLILAQEFNLEIKEATKTKLQRDESIRLELTFTKEEMELIEKARSLLSNKTGGGLKETFLEMAQKIVKPTVPRMEVERSGNATATVAVTKSITPRVRRQTLSNHGFCKYQDLKTGQVCGAKYFLQVDHIIPRFAGGGHQPENLRALCKSHNIYRFKMGTQVLRIWF